jgi:hypothetical protein
MDIQIKKKDSNIRTLLLFMSNDTWYREKDIAKAFPKFCHMGISSLLYYGYGKKYIERRKRTIRNFEYKRIIHLDDVEAM